MTGIMPCVSSVWSISTSIALAEALVPDRATTPWLGWPGLSITAILFALAAVASTKIEIKQDHFIASTRQFVVAAVVCILVIAAAFLLPRRAAARTQGWVANPWLVGAGALTAGSIFLVVPNTWGWWAVAIYLLLDTAVIAAVFVLSHRAGWDTRHHLALAAGAALAYAWHAFIQTPAVGGAHSLRMVRIGNTIFAAALLVLLIIAARRTASQVTRDTTT